jgi:hypothetical protein
MIRSHSSSVVPEHLAIPSIGFVPGTFRRDAYLEALRGEDQRDPRPQVVESFAEGLSSWPWPSIRWWD